MLLRIIIFILLAVTSLSVNAQSKLTGTVRSEDSIPLNNITILNKENGQSVASNDDGTFSLSAQKGDTVLFKALGYTPLLYIVKKERTDITIWLKRSPIELNTINIIKYNYHKDSLKFREEYAREFAFRRPRWNEVVPMMGLGFTVNINQLYKAVSFKKNKRKEKFKKILIAKEKENSVQRVFTPELVTKLTGLQGDSLNQFMIKYEPTYEFIKDASTYDVWLYITQNYKQFSKGL
ncbi:carboxypeptidase-like regulatory domain-containing protein [Chitinophaga terrae (ex Kim and Jung 2007)]|uniref:carboxypeptidase-like regulatory domain-containing protein n=1 Tax=Chitinophaga terrae (ex Kim and Jung 2007) TaxID=408074 RepID=UPI0027D7E9AC|nr:carboxypeptidase-like regulatory domain-containing protein [Chitinophaga terrae (ex Kim and Jung 2007)]